MDKLKLTRADFDTIRDALEMRVRECRKLTLELSSGTGKQRNEVERRLALTFKVTGDKAEALLNRIDVLEGELL